MTNTFLIVFSAVFGAILGSFFNVVALRDEERATIVKGRSQCPHCKHVLAWYDLVPLLSFLSIGGKCRYCRAKLSWQYPVAETLAAILVAGATWYGYIERGDAGLAGGLALSLLVLLAVSLIDLRTMSVPLDYVIVAGVIGSVAMVATGQLSALDSVRGMAVGAGSLAVVLYGWELLFHQKGMGEGDIVIAGAIGAIVGYPLVLVALMSAVFIGAIVGSLMVSVQKKSYASAIPFGPFLFMGLLVALVAGQSILGWYILYP